VQFRESDGFRHQQATPDLGLGVPDAGYSPAAVLLARTHCYLGWMERSLMRPRNRKILAGVCAAIADRFGISVTVVRLGFVFFGFFGVGELVYIALWILIPKAR
jgi:phage shock protein PspC (stress-responsive transcriptional regulator)